MASSDDEGPILSGRTSDQKAGASTADRIAVLGVGAALAFATLAQGAYYAPGLRPVLVMVAVAVVAGGFSRRGSRGLAGALPAAFWLALALWALAVGGLHGDLGAALPIAAMAGCLAAAVVAAAGLSQRSRHVLQLLVITLGTFVAVSAWAGVAFRLPPLALPSSGLWRGASTLTYANAAAAYLTITLIVAVTVLPARRVTNCVLAVLLLGMLATMSRAGGLGLLVGAVTYIVLTPDRARVRAAAPAVAAALVAGVGLLPSVPAAAPAQPTVALVAVGLAVLVAAPRMSRRYGAAR